MDRPELARLCGRVSIPGLWLGPVAHERGDENVVALVIIPLEDDRHRAARLGTAILDEPREPEPLGALCIHDLIITPRDNTDRLADRAAEVNLLDEKIPAP